LIECGNQIDITSHKYFTSCSSQDIVAAAAVVAAVVAAAVVAAAVAAAGSKLPG